MGVNLHPVANPTKRAAGFLGGWKAGEGIRRPVPLMEDDSDSDNQVRKNNANVEESPEERWMRERDDWLFGRSVSPPSNCWRLSETCIVYDQSEAWVRKARAIVAREFDRELLVSVQSIDSRPQSREN